MDVVDMFNRPVVNSDLLLIAEHKDHTHPVIPGLLFDNKVYTDDTEYVLSSMRNAYAVPWSTVTNKSTPEHVAWEQLTDHVRSAWHPVLDDEAYVSPRRPGLLELSTNGTVQMHMGKRRLVATPQLDAMDAECLVVWRVLLPVEIVRTHGYADAMADHTDWRAWALAGLVDRVIYGHVEVIDDTTYRGNIVALRGLGEVDVTGEWTVIDNRFITKIY